VSGEACAEGYAAREPGAAGADFPVRVRSFTFGAFSAWRSRVSVEVARSHGARSTPANRWRSRVGSPSKVRGGTTSSDRLLAGRSW
jgi:hypothetical protein